MINLKLGETKVCAGNQYDAWKLRIKRKIKSKKVFKGGEFEANHKAVDFLKKKGYSIGTMQGDLPILAVKGKWKLTKWDNLFDKAFEKKDIAVLRGDQRDGPVTIIFFENK